MDVTRYKHEACGDMYWLPICVTDIQQHGPPNRATDGGSIIISYGFILEQFLFNIISCSFYKAWRNDSEDMESRPCMKIAFGT